MKAANPKLEVRTHSKPEDKIHNVQTEWIGFGVLAFRVEIIRLLFVSHFVLRIFAVGAIFDIHICEQLAPAEKGIAQQDQDAAPE